MRLLSWALALALTSSLSVVGNPEPAQAVGQKDRARVEFLNLWQARLDSYRTQSLTLEAANKASVQALLNADENQSDRALFGYFEARIASGEIYGRGELLRAFVDHMKTKPSLGLTRAWLQEQLSIAQGLDQQAQKLASGVEALAGTPTTKVRDFYSAVEDLGIRKGEAIGRTRELMLVLDNFSAYADEFERADAKDREARSRFANALAGFARGLQANQGWQAQCIRTGNMVKCNGR